MCFCLAFFWICKEFGYDISASGQGGSCPEKNGRYPTRTCDGYIECRDGVPEEKLCPDGLLFNPAAGVFAFPCQYPIDVDCTGREQTRKYFLLK